LETGERTLRDDRTVRAGQRPVVQTGSGLRVEIQERAAGQGEGVIVGRPGRGRRVADGAIERQRGGGYHLGLDVDGVGQRSPVVEGRVRAGDDAAGDVALDQ